MKGFSACLHKSTGSSAIHCCHSDVGVGLGISATFLKFYGKVFYIMGKVLSGELFCMWSGQLFCQFLFPVETVIFGCCRDCTQSLASH